MLSLGMFSARAACTASRSRGFMSGSGRPVLAATVISRASLANILERAASCRPLRCMMFLNCEWPAMWVRLRFSSRTLLIRATDPRPQGVAVKPASGRFQQIGADHDAVDLDEKGKMPRVV